MRALHWFLVLLVWICLCAESRSGGGETTPAPSLLYVTRKDIRIANSSRINSKIKVQILVRNLTDGSALDFNYAARKLCWTDHGLEMIQCVNYDGTEAENKVEVINTGLISPDGLACDWFTNKLYWTDGETNRIEVATMTGEYRKVLFWSDLDQPRAIALVPMKSIMFWTDWGEVPKIERAGMNGDPATRKMIVSDNNIFWPNGLTVDYESELVYWLDGKLKFIAVMDYDGKKLRKILSHGLIYPFAITQFQNRLYWTDWSTWSIHTLDSNSSREPKELVHSDHCPMQIHVWDPRRQPSGYNPCEKNNGNCSHLCLLAPYDPGYTCACPIGIKLKDNHTCMDGPQEILLLAVRKEIIVIYLDSLDYTHKTIPLTGVKYSIAVDYDPVENYIYWSDDEVKAIQRAKLDGSDQQNIIIDDIYHPDGLAIDWVAGNLYWTDTGTDRIEVSRLNGSFRKVLLYEGLAEPRAIAVAPEHGWIFWSDWNEQQPKIERACLDGSERMVLVNDSLGWPNGVTLDLERSKLYWCDGKTDKIEVINMDGSDRLELTDENLPHSFGLSLMGDYLYWTDWQRRAIDRVHKITGGGRETLVDQMPNMMGLKAVRLGKARGSNPCRENNGGCAQLCLNRPKHHYVCACQMTFELGRDGRSCVEPAGFLLYSRNSTIGRISVENQNGDADIPVLGVRLASALDFDVVNRRLYWADSKLRAVFSASINGLDVRKVVDAGARAVDDMVVDWPAQNLFWLDSAAGRVEVVRLDGTSRRTLLWEGLVDPKSITIDPRDGYVYWSEWGSARCISRAFLDGSQPEKIILNSGLAKSLALDHEEHELYWLDMSPSSTSIWRSDLDGHRAKQILGGLSKPVGLTVHAGILYWVDGDQLFSASKNDGFIKIPLGRTRARGITDLVAVHSSRLSLRNACSINNGGCSHLCLARPNGRTCACPAHYSPTNTSCVPPPSFLIYTQRNAVVRLLPEPRDCPEAVLPLQGLKSVRAVDYDPVSRFVYWIEGKSHWIRRAHDDGTQVGVVVGGPGAGEPFDLAVDPLGRLLFWSCAARDVINVTRLDNGSAVGVVVKREGEKPRLLAVHPAKRLLFWTDAGVQSRLVRARLDGSQRIPIKVARDIAALSLDLDKDMVVWTDGSEVYTCNLEGDNQYALVAGDGGGITQLAVRSGFLYWLEKGHPQLRRFDLRTPSVDSLRLSQTTGHITDLVAVRPPPVNHSCAPPHRCSHICLGDERELICACPQGLALQDDHRTCAAVPDCGREHFTCGRDRHALGAPTSDCIPVAWRCDGQKDCQDGSDERDCPSCRPDQFRCQTGQCIERAWLCDGSAHCPDGYDEIDCCRPHEEFKCPETGVCISISELCDGTEHCADGADESEVVCSPERRSSENTPARSQPAPAYALALAIALSTAVPTVLLIIYYRRCFLARRDRVCDPLAPKPTRPKNRTVVPDVVTMSMLTPSYERRHVTGASSSTNGSSSPACYPRETLNPPPSPATTAASTRGSSPPRYRPYRHYRSINQPPPPTPCSTDVCDESDYNCSVRNPFPPPPTPRSHCYSESCPPSPSSRSSTYFSPLPPPPSPVPTPSRGYDS